MFGFMRCGSGGFVCCVGQGSNLATQFLRRTTGSKRKSGPTNKQKWVEIWCPPIGRLSFEARYLMSVTNRPCVSAIIPARFRPRIDQFPGFRADATSDGGILTEFLVGVPLTYAQKALLHCSNRDGIS